MSAVIKEFLKFRRVGFSKKSIGIFLVLLAPSLFAMFFIILRGNNLPAVVYVLYTTGDIFAAAFVPLLIIGNYNSNKYVLYTTLPIKNDNLFKFIYLETYGIIVSTFLVTGVINFILYDIYSLFVQMFKMALALCISNVFIAKLSTKEFLTNSDNQQTGIVAIILSVILIGTFFITILIVAGPETPSNFLNNDIAKIVIISLSITCMIIAVLTLKKSYLHTMNKARLMKY